MLDPISILIAVMIVAALVAVTPKAIADAIVRLRASKAGQWDFLDRDWERRDQRAQRRAERWHNRRGQRAREAGRADGDYEPGFEAYWRDLKTGWWARRQAKLRARRIHRDPHLFDPTRPTWEERIAQAVDERVDALRGTQPGRHRQAPEQPQTPSTPTDGNTEPEPQPEPATWNAPTDPQGNPPAAPTTPAQPATPPTNPTGQNPSGPTDSDAAEPTRPPLGPVPKCPACGWTWGDNGCLNPDCPTNADEQPANGGTDMTAPVIEEVTTNEALRRNAQQQRDAAAKLADALAAAEQARKELAQLAAAASDGTSAKRFDRTATAAAQEVADNVNAADLGEWHGMADAARAAADRVVTSLDKYQDSENLIVAEDVDPSTMAPVAA